MSRRGGCLSDDAELLCNYNRRMYDVLQKAHDHARSFLDQLPGRPVHPTASLEELRRTLRVAMTEGGEPAEKVLDDLVRAADPGIMPNAGGRFFGFVVGGALPVSVAADWMVSAWDQNPGIYALAPAEAVIEETAAAWVLELLGLPSQSSVGFVTGAQMANFTALAAARYEQLRQAGWDVNLDGLQGAPELDIIVGEEVHVTVTRALRYLGLGTRRMRVIAADSQGRMKASELETALKKRNGPTIVCAQAGNVNSGAVDPIGEIAEATRSARAWLHVDGAFGLWARAVPSMKHLIEGVERADSWATDAHKWLNVPQDSGIVIVANAAAHKAAVSTDAAYLIKTAGAERDAIDGVPEFSRRGRGVPVYAALRHLGRSGLAAMIERCCRHARTMAERLAAFPGVEVLNEVVLNQVLVRFIPESGSADEFTRAVIRRIQEDGTCWLGGSIWKEKGVMRISVSSWATTDQDVDASLDAIVRCFAAEKAAQAEGLQRTTE